VEALGIHTLGELRQAAPSQLRPIFGRYTERLQQRAAGIDERPVLPDVDEKQISAEETFDTDIVDPARMHTEIVRLADKACSRLRMRRLVGGCVTVKIRRGDFTTYTRQRQVEPRTQETRVVARVAAELLDAWRKTQPRAALRLLGVGVSDLGEEVQGDLFGAPESTRNRQLDAAVDAVREKFGSVALRPASTIVKARE
jgi:DNA polymerase-4